MSTPTVRQIRPYGCTNEELARAVVNRIQARRRVYLLRHTHQPHYLAHLVRTAQKLRILEHYL